MYLLAQDTLNGAEGKITVTRDGRITEICGMKNIKTVAGIQTSDIMCLALALSCSRARQSCVR